MNTSRGFTIVEILVVVVMIGVLASIAAASYGTIAATARNSARATEIEGWRKMFESYNAAYGHYPSVANGYYCLGQNFPKSATDNQRGCRNFQMTDPAYRYLESDSVPLVNQLLEFGRLPTNNPPSVNGGLVGPYVNYWGTGMQIMEFFESKNASDCANKFKMTYSYDDGSGSLLCVITIGT